MLGAIVGDIVDSVHEGRGNAIKTPDFPLFRDYSHWTDDSVLTMAVADRSGEIGTYTLLVIED